MWLKLAPYLAIVAVVSLFGWKLYQFGYERGKAAGERPYIAAITEAAERYAQAVAAQQETITDLQTRLGRARAATAASTTRLDTVLTHEPESRDWGAVRLPDAIRMLVADDPDAVSGHTRRNP
jgi:hypothetical protein